MLARIKYVFILIFFLHLGFSFKPRSFEIFEKNCIRLLTTRQYTFLSAYFLEHNQHFLDDKRVVNLALNIVKDCPLLKVKSDILTYLLKLDILNSRKREVFFECGLLHYFQEKWSKSAGFFSLSHQVMASYYLGDCYFKLKEFKKAEYYFNVFIVKSKLPSHQTHFAKFRLAEIAHIKKKHRESYKLLLKSNYQGLDRNVLLYRIYKETGDVKLAREVLKVLKTKYKNDVKVKSLSKEKGS